MLYDLSHRDDLKAWLVKSLEPICDAEPEALAAYVLALLSHDAPEHELRKEIVKQLEEFLETGSASFVETLFATLRTKSYVPYTSSVPEPSSSSNNAAPAADTGIPIPLDAFLSSASPGRGHKRGLEDDSGYQGPSKGSRLSDGPFSRHPQQNGQSHLENGSVWQPENFGGMGMGRGVERRRLPYGVCRDYHVKGYCSRGATCKYSHDDDAFLPGQMPFNGMSNGMGIPGPIPGLPFMPMMPFPMGLHPAQSPTYDPNESHMDMRPFPQQNQTLGTQGQNGGEAPSVPVNGQPEQDITMNGTAPEASIPNRGKPMRGGNPSFRGRGRGGHGTFSGDHQNFRGNEGKGRHDSKTLVVEKIPEEHLSLEGVNAWFKRFGTVTNVAVDSNTTKALVSFASHEEAHAAWKSEEAVFNNRFVKVFWHKPMEGQGALGARALQASAPILAMLAAQEAKPSPPTVKATPAPAPAPPTVPLPVPIRPKAPGLTVLAAKQQLLEKILAEQKELMGKLSSASPVEKKDIMARLRKLDAELSSTKSSAMTPAPSTPSKSPAPMADKEWKAKELLDMEMEVHAKATEASVTNDMATESLQEKLERLRAEASALGISDSPTSAPYTSHYRGYRGRGRARGGFRGMRGGPPPARPSMKLDNRPKTLVVSGVQSLDPEAVQAIRGWYELGGQVASLDVLDGDSVIVTFKSRVGAEQALTKGGTLPPPVGKVKLGWHTERVPAAKSIALTPSLPGAEQKVAPPDDRPPSPRPEDILEESGWGDGEEDGMGML